MVKLSPYSTGNWVSVGHQTQMKSTQKHEMYTANAKVLRLVPNETYIPLTRVGGFALGNVKNASPNTRDTNMLVLFALGNAKGLSFALCEAKVPNANGFASQWNIGIMGLDA